MDTNRAKLTNVIKKAMPLTSLLENPDFQTFKAEVIDRRMDKYLKEATNADLTTEAGRAKAIRDLQCYQDLHFMFEEIFQRAEAAETQARTKLRTINNA